MAQQAPVRREVPSCSREQHTRSSFQGSGGTDSCALSAHAKHWRPFRRPCRRSCCLLHRAPHRHITGSCTAAGLQALTCRRAAAGPPGSCCAGPMRGRAEARYARPRARTCSSLRLRTWAGVTRVRPAPGLRCSTCAGGLLDVLDSWRALSGGRAGCTVRMCIRQGPQRLHSQMAATAAAAGCRAPAAWAARGWRLGRTSVAERVRPSSSGRGWYSSGWTPWQAASSSASGPVGSCMPLGGTAARASERARQCRPVARCQQAQEAHQRAAGARLRPGAAVLLQVPPLLLALLALAALQGELVCDLLQPDGVCVHLRWPRSAPACHTRWCQRQGAPAPPPARWCSTALTPGRRVA